MPELQVRPEILDEKELAAIARTGRTKNYPARSIVVAEGEPTDALYVILEGKCQAYVTGEDGREVVLSDMGPGEYFGEVAIDEGPRSASVMTLEPSHLLIVPRDQFRDFLGQNPDFAFHFIRKLLHRIRELTRSLGGFQLLDDYGRVARWIGDAAHVDERGQMVVGEGISREELAGRAGCPHETFSRILDDLARGGFVTLENDRIVVHRKPPQRW